MARDDRSEDHEHDRQQEAGVSSLRDPDLVIVDGGRIDPAHGSVALLESEHLAALEQPQAESLGHGPQEPGRTAGEPLKHRPHRREIEEERKRLRGEVVLPDPIGDSEDPSGGPDHPVVGGEAAQDHDQRPDVQEVEHERGPGCEGRGGFEPSEFGQQGAETEERGPIVIDVEHGNIGLHHPGPLHEVDDPDVLPRP
jgi:hypothetical protein